MDVLQLPPFFEILKRLGYPGYFAVILGVWKLLGAPSLTGSRLESSLSSAEWEE
jgi:hypothetical protein